jgi:hypothetical protein
VVVCHLTQISEAPNERLVPMLYRRAFQRPVGVASGLCVDARNTASARIAASVATTDWRPAVGPAPLLPAGNTANSMLVRAIQLPS